MYAPASNTTGNAGWNHLATVWYDRAGLDALREKWSFWRLTENKLIPRRNGTTAQFFRYTNLGADATPVVTTEGAVGTGLELASTSFQASVSQYADWSSVSDLLVDTSISDEVTNAADQLGYRGGTSANNILKNEIDSVAASIDLSLLGSFFQARDGLHVAQLLQGLNIRPLRDGVYEALIHPYVVYDFLSDPQAGGFQDIVKQPGSDQRGRLFSIEDRGFVAQVGGVRYWAATDVTQVTGTPNKWRVYFAGRGGVAALDLAGRGPQRTMDHEQTRFRVNMVPGGPSQADPAGKIKNYVSYNFVFSAKILDATNYRLRKMDAPSGIVA
jgi:hypothetical protein